MKKITFLFAFVCVLFANQAAAQQQYPFAVIIPNGHPAKAVKAPNAVATGKWTVKEGLEIDWTIMYNDVEQKLATISFSYPAGIDKGRFESGIQAMMSWEFWNGVYNCLNSGDLHNCGIALMTQAVQDCSSLGGDHCWMYPPR